MELTEITAKLQEVINTEIECATKRGNSKLSTCDDRNWDQDVWNYRHQIIDTLRAKGYNVSVSVKWGVTDIVTTPKITFT